MRIVIATLSVVFAACVIGVTILNYAERVTVRFWPNSPGYVYPETPVSWVIFYSVLAGFVFAGIIAILEGSKTRLSNARLRTQVRKLQQELTALRQHGVGEIDREPILPEPPPADEPIEMAPDEDDSEETPGGGVSRAL